ncbi:MAG: hypothetical protein HY397_03155 [Candidatus Doudnabacteria bacterium]|nr:hypothetical protein [Candidatus Doudnabacteria bacterium]
MLLDIVILPPKGLREKIGRAVTRSVAGRPTVFVVDNKKLIPHLSLFHLRTSPARVSKVTTQVRIISKKHHTSRVRLLKVEIVGRFLGMTLSNNPKLKKLNREVVAKTRALRTGMMPWTSAGRPKLWEQKNRERYGTQHNIGKTFRPHFTLAILKDHQAAAQATNQLKNLKFSFSAGTIAVCEVNWWHQVTRVIKTFKLKK